MPAQAGILCLPPMTTPDISARKAALRAEMLGLRASLDPALGARLAAHVLASGTVPPGTVVAGYWPMPHEIDILPLLHGLHERGHVICLPETTKPGSPLLFRAWTPGAEMVRGRYNTSHPTGPALIPDVLLIPLLAFDPHGHRLGYGGGYYDRTLAELPHAFRLGCAFAAQAVAAVPRETTDLPLHAIATESGLHFTPANKTQNPRVWSKNMRVVECDDYGPPEVLHLAERPIPAAVPGTVRIRVHAAAVNPADVKLRQGMFASRGSLNFPQVLGYDIAGTIDELGAGVTGVSPGERVFAMLDMRQRGAYAEYVLVPAADVVPIPEKLDFATAAAIPTGGLTGVQMIEEHAKPQPGDTVLITGAIGSVGRFAMFAARRHGAHIIAAVRENQRDEARALGAAETLILGAETWSGPDFKYVIDTIGGDAVAQLCRHLRQDGAIFTAATTPINAQGLISAPVFIVVHNDPARLKTLAANVAAGELPVPIGQRLPLAQAAQAHRLVEKGAPGGKIILEP